MRLFGFYLKKKNEEKKDLLNSISLSAMTSQEEPHLIHARHIMSMTHTFFYSHHYLPFTCIFAIKILTVNWFSKRLKVLSTFYLDPLRPRCHPIFMSDFDLSPVHFWTHCRVRCLYWIRIHIHSHTRLVSSWT